MTGIRQLNEGASVIRVRNRAFQQRPQRCLSLAVGPGPVPIKRESEFLIVLALRNWRPPAYTPTRDIFPSGIDGSRANFDRKSSSGPPGAKIDL
jgi:hypothetical protein